MKMTYTHADPFFDGDLVQQIDCEATDYFENDERHLGLAILMKFHWGLSLHLGSDVGRHLDAVSGDLAVLTPLVEEALEEQPGDILILDHLQVAPEYRGFSLGLQISARSILTHSSGVNTVFVMVPEKELGLLDYYAKLGFQPHADVVNVMWMELDGRKEWNTLMRYAQMDYSPSAPADQTV